MSVWDDWNDWQEATNGIADFWIDRRGRLLMASGRLIEHVRVEVPVEPPSLPSPPQRHPDPLLSRVADLARTALYAGEPLDPTAVLDIVGAPS